MYLFSEYPYVFAKSTMQIIVHGATFEGKPLKNNRLRFLKALGLLFEPPC
jgi:hypothetical protein